MPVRHRSLRFGTLEVVLVASLLGGAYVVAASERSARDVIGREEQGLATLRGLLDAERRFLAKTLRDDDHDGKGEFGSLDDLVAAGLWEGPVTRDADVAFTVRGPYRYEVLLPGGVHPTGVKTLVEGHRGVDARLASATVAVVALPHAAGPRVLRGFYLDAAGYGYVAEGVYAADRDPTAPAPRVELREEKDRGGRDDGPNWRAFEQPAGAKQRGKEGD